MPDISKLTMPNGVEYNIKDSQARKDIEKIKKSGGGSSGGSGLPDASEYKNGTALIAIDGEFVPAEGYGYLGEDIKWDMLYHPENVVWSGMMDGDSSLIQKIPEITLVDQILSGTLTFLNGETELCNWDGYDQNGVISFSADIFIWLYVYSSDWWQGFAEEIGIEEVKQITDTGFFVLCGNRSEMQENDCLYSAEELGEIDVSSGIVFHNVNSKKIDKNLYDASKVSFSPSQWSGTQIGTLTIDSNDYFLYTPSISFTRNQASGAKIGTLKIGYTNYDLYAPSITVSSNLTSGTQIATINGTQIYAPTPAYNYRNIKRILANGDGATMFPLWSQIAVPHKEFGTIIFDVIDYDDENKALTLFMTDCIVPQYEFDAAEPNNQNSGRKNFGSSNYGQSAIRQWLNATAESGWWEAKVSSDVAPSYANKPGFLAGFPSDFIDILSPTQRKCVTNKIVENGYVDGTPIYMNSEYTVNDLIFLPSYTELTGANNRIAEGTQFQAFQKYGTTNIDKYNILIKRNIKTGENCQYLFRSCEFNSSAYMRYVLENGSPQGADGHPRDRDYGFAAACVIKG